jgi:hypothetical protein
MVVLIEMGFVQTKVGIKFFMGDNSSLAEDDSKL